MFLALGYAVIVSVIAKTPTLWVTAILVISSTWHEDLRAHCLLIALGQPVGSAASIEGYLRSQALPIPRAWNCNADTIAGFATNWTWCFADLASNLAFSIVHGSVLGLVNRLTNL